MSEWIIERKNQWVRMKVNELAGQSVDELVNETKENEWMREREGE